MMHSRGHLFPEHMNRFIVLYSGNMGLCHEFETILVAASRLIDVCPRILFAFVGTGARHHEVASAAKRLPNVKLFPFQPRARLPQTLSAADAHLITLRSDVRGLVVPSKFYSAIACGRPVLYVGPCDTDMARDITKDRLGEVVANGDVHRLVDVLLGMAQADSNKSDEQRIRTVFERRFDRPIAVRRWVGMLEGLKVNSRERHGGRYDDHADGATDQV